MSHYNRSAEEDDQARTLMGLLLHRARMHRGMTRAALGRKAGYPASRIRELEKGIGRSGRFDDLERVANALEMRIQMAVAPAELVERLIEHPVGSAAEKKEEGGDG